MLAALRIARASIRLACVVGLSLAALVPAARAQDEPSALERRVKAAFLYKFTGYATWPEGTFARADTPMTIGVLGDDQLAAETAQQVGGRTIDGRPISVKRVASAELAGDVHILFVGRAEAARFAQIVRALPAAPMLIATESESALRQGSAINFVIVDGRVRFDVALDAAERRGVKLSSRLLAVARSVQGASQ
jgi:YfiR/HmsC-like